MNSASANSFGKDENDCFVTHADNIETESTHAIRSDKSGIVLERDLKLPKLKGYGDGFHSNLAVESLP
ncbi:type I glyceraldehyde-3-phosphate dehydrogenase [Sesbania bispinosa]|nr:type I glyceraldehyde-3-phosphate dehydrogenase [Sesbania bispinosa]